MVAEPSREGQFRARGKFVPKAGRISCWIEAALAPKTVQTFAGHSTLAVTMDRYGHLLMSDDYGRAMNDIGDRYPHEAKPRREPPLVLGRGSVD